MAEPIPANIVNHPAWRRLESQHKYYSDRADECQASYKLAKLFLIGLAAALPLLALLPGEEHRYLVAAAGIAIAVLEGLLLLNQYGPLWVQYRSTAEKLQRERWLLLSGAGDYRGLPEADALRLLAERIEALMDGEHGAWAEAQNKILAQLAKAKDEDGKDKTAGKGGADAAKDR